MQPHVLHASDIPSNIRSYMPCRKSQQSTSVERVASPNIQGFQRMLLAQRDGQSHLELPLCFGCRHLTESIVCAPKCTLRGVVFTSVPFHSYRTGFLIYTNCRSPNRKQTCTKMPPITINSSWLDQGYKYTPGQASTNNNTSNLAPAFPANEAPEEYLEDSDSDDDTEEPGYAYGKYRVNLREAEDTYNWGPVFDNELFKIISHMREQALEGKVKAILYPDLLGNLQTIWERSESGEYNIFTLYATQIDLYKGSHTKMPHKRLPEIQSEPPYQRSTMVELVHKYNPGKEWIPCPFVLQNVKKTVCKIHLNEGAMKKSYGDLNYTLGLWQKSQARVQLERRFHMASQGSVQIKKIVCLGLGSLLEPDMSTPGLLQHLAAFTIARKLNACYKSVDPNCPPIKIFAQDPSYSESDRILLQRIDPITFVSDPQGFLEIDENTLVISFCLPFEVPLMQMLPDIFGSNCGPAGILSDTLHLDPTRSVYRYRRRDSPSVCRMLCSGEYRSRGFQGWSLDADPELYKEIFPTGKKTSYWLSRTTLYLRRQKVQQHDLSNV